MKYLALSLVILSGTCQAFEQDKIKHFGVSAAIGSAAYLVTDDRFLSYSGTLAVGAMKELTDAKFDWADMAANLAGAVVGIEVTKFLGEKWGARVGSDFVALTYNTSF